MLDEKNRSAGGIEYHDSLRRTGPRGEPADTAPGALLAANQNEIHAGALGELARYERPLSGVQNYDQLLSGEVTL